MSTDAADSIKLRIKTVINPNIDPVYFNIVRAKVFPYAVVFPPYLRNRSCNRRMELERFTLTRN